MLSLLGLKSSSAQLPSSLPPIRVLVIQSDDYDWCGIFRGRHLADGRQIEVVQTSWDDLVVGPCSNVSEPVPTSTFLKWKAQQPQEGPNTGMSAPVSQRIRCQCRVQKQWRNGKAVPQETERPLMFTPDFVLVRNEVTTVDNQKGRKQLLALLYANVPSINSLQTILLCCDKPAIQAGLHRVRSKYYRGKESDFPLIPQELYTGTSTFFYGGSFPAVLKFGSAHAGYGKVKVPHYRDMDDFRTLLPMTVEGYVTAEPFVTNSGGDYRIQKIGKHIRAFKRFDISGSWKTNTGTGVLMFEVPVTKKFQEWVENASKLFGEDEPLDICTVDAIVELPPGAQVEFPEGLIESQSSTKPSLLPVEGFPDPDKEKIHILELNGTSSGLHPDYGTVDNNYIADLVIERLNAIYCV